VWRFHICQKFERDLKVFPLVAIIVVLYCVFFVGGKSLLSGVIFARKKGPKAAGNKTRKCKFDLPIDNCKSGVELALWAGCFFFRHKMPCVLYKFEIRILPSSVSPPF